jgi:putative MATE family efflux protein
MPQNISGEQNNWILEESVLKVMVKLGIPIAVGETLNLLYSMADIYWLGRVGREALASVSASWPVVWLIVSIAAGMFAAGISIVSQYWGMNNQKKAIDAGGQVLLLAMLLGTPLALVGFYFSGNFMVILGVPESTLPTAVVYVRFLSLGIPFIAVYESFSAIFSATGDTITPLKMRALGVLLNIVLDPLLIFGYFSFPQLGVLGAAIATVLSQMAVVLVWAAIIVIRGINGQYITFDSLKPDFEIIRKIVRIGYPLSALMFGEASGFAVLVYVISLLGSTPLAAWGMADRILGLFHVFIAGMLGATSTMIGQSLGAGLTERAKLIAKRASAYSSLIMAVGVAILIPFRYQISAFFAPGDTTLIKQAGDFILIMGPSIIFFMIYLASRAVAQGSGHTKPVMFLGLLRLWVLRNVLAYLFGPGPIGMGVDGLWLGMAISNYITGTLALWWIVFGRWNTPVVERSPERIIENSG